MDAEIIEIAHGAMGFVSNEKPKGLILLALNDKSETVPLVLGKLDYIEKLGMLESFKSDIVISTWVEAHEKKYHAES